MNTYSQASTAASALIRGEHTLGGVHSTGREVIAYDQVVARKNGAALLIIYPQHPILSSDASTRVIMNAVLRGLGLGNVARFSLKAQHVSDLGRFSLRNAEVRLTIKASDAVHAVHFSVKRGVELPIATSELAMLACLPEIAELCGHKPRFPTPITA